MSRKETANAPNLPEANPALFDVYPWHRQVLSDWMQDERLAHAYLLYGPQGIGKFELGLAAAASLLCDSPQSGLACRSCASCRLFSQYMHPDFRLLIPEQLAMLQGWPVERSSKAKPSREILTEQVRGLGSLFTVSTQRGGRRVVMIYLAETLNQTSSNAILKLVEEPPENSVFILVSHALQKVLPTLISRCRRLALPMPLTQEVEPWLTQQLGTIEGASADQGARLLAQAGGAPLLALNYAKAGQEPLQQWLGAFLTSLREGYIPDVDAVIKSLSPAAGKKRSLSPEEEAAMAPAVVLVDTLNKLCLDIVLCLNGLPLRYYPSQTAVLQTLLNGKSVQKAHELAQWVRDQGYLTQAALNEKLFLSSILQKVAVFLLPRRR